MSRSAPSAPPGLLQGLLHGLRNGPLQALLLGLAFATPAVGASVHPFDPELSPSLYALASCNFEVDLAMPAVADCFHQRIVENPATLTSVAGDGEATADLRTGTLRARGIARAYRFGADNLRANGSAEARLYDTLTIVSGDPESVELRMTVSGRMLDAVVASPVTGQAVVSLYAFDDVGNVLGQANVWIEQYTSGGAFLANSMLIGRPGSITTNADVHGDFDPEQDIEVTISMLFPINPAERTFTFGASLASTAAIGPFVGIADLLQTNEVDFSDAATLSVHVPAGVAWTSESGEFLVPEPSLGALCGAGALTLAAIGSRSGAATRGARARRSGRCATR